MSRLRPVPSNMAHSIMDQLVQHGKVVRGWLGVSIQELALRTVLPVQCAQEVKGVLVSDVMDDSPAKKAGFERGECHRDAGSKPMDSPAHLRNAVAQTNVGKKVSVKIIREKKAEVHQLAIAEHMKNLAQAGVEEGGESVAPAGLYSDIEVGS
ncbi:MAG: S1C family serine protease [Nitrospira sp.]|nr:S1C family serine protease [Nitrospira sp.]